jgi:hypothetical protein
MKDANMKIIAINNASTVSDAELNKIVTHITGVEDRDVVRARDSALRAYIFALRDLKRANAQHDIIASDESLTRDDYYKASNAVQDVIDEAINAVERAFEHLIVCQFALNRSWMNQPRQNSNSLKECEMAKVETSEVRKLTDTETMLSVLQSENARLKQYAETNARTAEQNAETHRKGYESWRKENLRLQTELLAAKERVFELQDKLLSLRKIINSVWRRKEYQMKNITIMGGPSATTVDLTEPTGPRAASGRHAELLADLQNATARLAELIELERTGVCDGQGFWIGSDPLLDTARKLVRIAEQRVSEFRRWAMARRARLNGAAYRRRRAADTARWRSRQRRGVQLFQFEAGEREYDLAIRFAGLREDQGGNKTSVNAALGRLLRKALVALLACGGAEKWGDRKWAE